MITPQRAERMETELVSLAGYSLADVRSDRSRALADAVQVVLRQVERPRANLGGGGPPGRAD
jgi:hypothetical protein